MGRCSVARRRKRSGFDNVSGSHSNTVQRIGGLHVGEAGRRRLMVCALLPGHDKACAAVVTDRDGSTARTTTRCRVDGRTRCTGWAPDVGKRPRRVRMRAYIRAMRVLQQVIVLDAADMDAEAAFWAALLDGIVEPDENWRSIIVDGRWHMGIQYAPNHVTPEWPHGEQQQQIHLDLYVDDLRRAHQRVVELGARLLQPANNPDADEGFQVYADPAGHPFCLCWTKSP